MSISFVVDDKDIDSLKQKWEELSSFYTSDETIQGDIFQFIKEKYSEKSRFYHNLSHVTTLLSLCELLHSYIQNHRAIQFAIWFHDVIYTTQRRDNEVESARVAAVILGRLQVNAEIMELVQGLILATIYHDGVNLSQDAKLFLDMDLAILGTSEEIYNEYSRAIRKEFAWVADLPYRKGRQQILKRFMKRDRIYFTDEMQARYEKQARINLKREIKSLNARN